MDSIINEPVLQATIKVLSSMAHVEPEPCEDSIKADSVAQGDVSGLITIQGKSGHGSMAVSFPKAVILDLVKRMLRVETSEIDDLARDLTGELANMILGVAKSTLEEQGYDFDLTLPRVVSGSGHLIEHPLSAPITVQTINTPAGKFYIETCFEN